MSVEIARPMTQGYLAESIGYLLATISERWPDRVSRDPGLMLPGTFVKVRDDLTLWIGDHILEDWGWSIEMLERVADSLYVAIEKLEAA